MGKTFTSSSLMLLAAAVVFGSSSPAYSQPAEPILTIEMGLHSAALREIIADPQYRILVTSSADKTVRLWDRSTGKLLKILRPPIGKGGEGFVHTIAISPDGNTIACGGNLRSPDKSQNIFFFDRESGRLIKRISGMPQAIMSLRFSKDGRRLAAGLWGNGRSSCLLF